MGWEPGRGDEMKRRVWRRGGKLLSAAAAVLLAAAALLLLVLPSASSFLSCCCRLPSPPPPPPCCLLLLSPFPLPFSSSFHPAPLLPSVAFLFYWFFLLASHCLGFDMPTFPLTGSWPMGQTWGDLSSPVRTLAQAWGEKEVAQLLEECGCSKYIASLRGLWAKGRDHLHSYDAPPIQLSPHSSPPSLSRALVGGAIESFSVLYEQCGLAGKRGGADVYQWLHSKGVKNTDDQIKILCKLSAAVRAQAEQPTASSSALMPMPEVRSRSLPSMPKNAPKASVRQQRHINK